MDIKNFLKNEFFVFFSQNSDKKFILHSIKTPEIYQKSKLPICEWWKFDEIKNLDKENILDFAKIFDTESKISNNMFLNFPNENPPKKIINSYSLTRWWLYYHDEDYKIFSSQNCYKIEWKIQKITDNYFIITENNYNKNIKIFYRKEKQFIQDNSKAQNPQYLVGYTPIVYLEDEILQKDLPKIWDDFVVNIKQFYGKNFYHKPWIVYNYRNEKIDEEKCENQYIPPKQNFLTEYNYFLYQWFLCQNGYCSIDFWFKFVFAIIVATIIPFLILKFIISIFYKIFPNKSQNKIIKFLKKFFYILFLVLLIWIFHKIIIWWHIEFDWFFI